MTRNYETAAKEANVTELLYEITKLQSSLICARMRGAHSTHVTVEKCPQNIGAKNHLSDLDVEERIIFTIHVSREIT